MVPSSTHNFYITRLTLTIWEPTRHQSHLSPSLALCGQDARLISSTWAASKVILGEPWGGRLVCASRWEETLPRLELYLLAQVQGPSQEREGGGGTPASYIISWMSRPEMKITSDLGKDLGASGEQALGTLGTLGDVFWWKGTLYPFCLCLGEVNATTLFSQRTYTRSCTCACVCACAHTHTQPP